MQAHKVWRLIAVIRSFCSFEVLPLVEFFPADGISDEDAEKYIGMDPAEAKDSKSGNNNNNGAQTLSLDSGGDGGAEEEQDAFHQQLLAEPAMDGSYAPIKCDIACLKSMKKEEVFVRKFGTRAMKCQYFRSVIPDLPITLCPSCNHFFHEEDFEFHLLQKKSCPFCRTQTDPEAIVQGDVANIPSSP